jgi:hypothetical protein
VTILVGIGSPDGLVLAADSRTTNIESSHHRISTDAAEKIFALNGRGRESAYGVATYGDAFIGERTISGLIDEFVATVDEDVCDDVERLADALGSFFHERYVAEHGEPDDPPVWSLGFILAGYDEAGIGHLWEINIPGPHIEKTPVNTPDRGALWRGQTGVIGRLIKGVDWNALRDAKAPSFSEQVDDTLKKLEYIVLHPVTLQDAVDMAAFLVRTTIDMQRFSNGPVISPGLIPGCGGRIQMITVTRAGAEWISRRRLTAPSRPGWAEGAAEFDG